MDRSRLVALVVVGVVVLAGGYVVGDLYFFPETATRADETGTGTVLATGTFVGKAGHDVSGTVELAVDDDGYYLQFREYEQEQGPDVFLYVTPAADPDTGREVDAGRKVLVDGGADGGEMTRVGTFVQRLPADFDPDAVQGVAIWCDRFGVPFGSATLTPV